MTYASIKGQIISHKFLFLPVHTKPLIINTPAGAIDRKLSLLKDGK